MLTGALSPLHVVALSWLAPYGRLLEPVHFDYRAPAGCLDAATFIGQVQGRTRRFRVAGPDEPAHRFTVTLTLPSRPPVPGEEPGAPSTASHVKIIGRLTFRELDGGESMREVAGDSCGEVLDALALIAALAIDPDAITTDVSPEPEPGPSPSAAAVPPSSRASPSGPLAVHAQVQPTPRAARAWSLGVGAQIGAIVGVAPDVLIYPSAFVELTKLRSSGAALSGRVGFARASDQLTVGAAVARFTWTVVLAEACVPLRLTARLSLQPCGHFTVGILRAAGSDLPHPGQNDQPWASVGITGGLRWRIRPGLAVEVENAVGAALVRDRFIFEPDVTIHEVPALHGTVRAGLALAWE